MKNSTVPSRLFRGIAVGLVMTSLSLSLLLARAQSTAAPVESTAARDAAARADLDALFDVQKPHIAKKSGGCPDKPCAPCPCQAAATECAKALPGCPALTVAPPDTRAADVAALFDVQVILHKPSKVQSTNNK
jgi:hypothetical protein